jgi:NAD(P)-dependent dehydrogenase (short-subunit alcohol dehydrogenase family)
MSHFWETPFERMWDGMFERGLRLHMAATHSAAPLMLERGGALIACTIAWDRDKYIGGLYDVSKHAIVRFVQGLSLELKKYSVAAVAVGRSRIRAVRTDIGRFQDERTELAQRADVETNRVSEIRGALDRHDLRGQEQNAENRKDLPRGRSRPRVWIRRCGRAARSPVRGAALL